MLLERSPERPTWPKPAGSLIPLAELVAEFLSDLEAECLTRLEALGPLRGRVTERQRPWSLALDSIATERESAA